MEFFYSTGVAISQHSRSVQHWLALCIALVALMVLIGGATRLTESGLSIVQWKLIEGTLPPMSEEAWNTEFTEYKTSPQYQQVNRDFTLGDFKHIYFLEYLHRLLGRATGLVFMLPWLYFAARRQISPALMQRMGVAVILIGLQGAVGWVMVASGLVDEPRVEPLKLALHLILAFSVFGFLLWMYWEARGDASSGNPSAGRAACWLLVLVALQIVMGALVAGLRAGWSYNTWPLMDGRFIPEHLYLLSPWWKNHVESILTVQFQHRMGAYAVALATLAYAAYSWHRITHKRPLLTLVAVVALQLTLGIAALLTHVELHTAMAHQLAALLLFAVVLRLIYINNPVHRSDVR